MIYFFETLGVNVLVGEMIKTNKSTKELMVPSSEGILIDSIFLVQSKNDWLFETKNKLSKIFPSLQK